MKKKIYKALSILLTLVIVFSACLCVLNTVSAATGVYYVKSGGNDSKDGSSKRNAVQTLNKIIELANAAGLGEGDTVTALVLDTTNVAWHSDSSAEKLTDHEFKLIVQSEAEDGSAIIGTGIAMHFGGDIEFKNIGVNFGSNYKSLYGKAHNVTFGEGSRIVGNALMFNFFGGANNSNVLNTTDNSYTLVCEMPIKYFGITNNYSKMEHNGDINVVYNAGTGNPDFYLGSSNDTVTYNAGVNITVKAAASVSFKDNYGLAFGDNGYVQIVNHTATELKAEGTDLANIPSDKLWVLNNKLQASDLFELTSTKGKYKVNTEVYSEVKATSVTDANTVIEEENGYLTLPAGVYNVTASKIPQTKTYYVEKDGTGDGSSEESPLGTIAAAVKKALADGCIVGDIVNVKVMGEEVDQGTYDNYAFTLNVDSNDPATKTRINVATTIANNTTAWTNYDNVELYRSGSWKSLQLQSGNVKIGSGVKFTHSYSAFVYGTGDGGGAKQTISGQKFIYNGATAPYAIHLSNWNYASVTYTDEVYLEYNVPGTTTQVGFNANYSGAPNGTTLYKEVVNINIKAAKEITYFNLSGATFEKGLQVINTAGTPAERTGELADLPADKVYFLNNVSGNGNLLEFTETIGTYKVNLDNPEHDVIAKNMETGEEITYDKTGTTITLPAGFYEVRVDRDPIYKDYYVSDDGIEIAAGERPATAGTRENPVKTYADATRLIAQDGLAAIDVATIYIPSGGVAYWGSEPTNFDCQLIITSTMEGDPGTLETTGNNSAVLTGNTTFRDVKFEVVYQYASFRINDNNLTIEETAEVNVPYTRLWATAHGAVHTKDVTVRIEGKFTTSVIGLNAEYHNHTATGNYDFYIDNPDTVASFVFGGGTSSSGPNTYNGNINITVMSAKAMSFSISDSGAVFNGAVQIMADDSVALPYNVKKNFEELNVAGGKWYITNAASDDDFVSFTDNKGIFATKDGADAYSRQFEGDNVKHTGGTVDLSAVPGAYTISDKEIAPITDDSHKMLYYRISGNGSHIGTRALVTPGETYVFEYSIFSLLYEDAKPQIRTDGDRNIVCDVEIVSEKKVGDYYRIVCKGTIPDDYSLTKAFFVVGLSSYDEGVIFDRTVYNANDRTKKDLLEGNQNYHDGLDYVSLNFDFWGRIFTGEKGGQGIMKWTNGFASLEIMNYDADFIKELIRLNNPNDGEWWEEDDIIEEETFATYAEAKGTFKDQNGNPISGAKMLLVSDSKSYTARTNARGKFDFGTILTGYYELFVVNGSNKIHTGFGAFISQDDVVTFNVVTDTSGLADDSLDGDYEFDGESTDGATSSFTGTVYTPQLETVAGLKILLKLGDEVKGEVVTDEKGAFGFANIPVGTYQIYAVNEDGSEYFFRDIEIEEDLTRNVKLKYEAPSQTGTTDLGWITYVIIAAVVALLAVGGLVVFLVLRKKKV